MRRGGDREKKDISSFRLQISNLKHLMRWFIRLGIAEQEKAQSSKLRVQS